MIKKSAGLLLFKRKENKICYFLVHPGGPFWKNKDEGAWSIPKGEPEKGEDLLQRAIIEFREETGQSVKGEFIELEPVRQKAGKTVYAWALEQDIGTSGLKSNTIMIDWPPRSGKKMEIPEVDRWEWFGTEEACKKINPAQAEFIIQVEKLLNG